MWLTVVLLGGAVVLSVAVYLRRTPPSKGIPVIPGAKPIVGHLPLFAAAMKSGTLSLMHISNMRKYGRTIAMQTIRGHVYATSDYNLAREFMSDLDTFGIALSTKPIFQALGPMGLLALEGETWKRHRKLIQPFFGAKMLGYVHTVTVRFFYSDQAELEESLATVRGEVRRIVQRRLEEGQGEKGTDVIGAMLATRQDEAQTGVQGLSDDEILDESLNLYLAGHETTSNGLFWCMFCLATNPTEQDRLREEVDRVCGTNEPTYEAVNNMEGEEVSKQAFMPFGHGPKTCVGWRVAMAEMRVFVARFMQAFTVSLSEQQARLVVPFQTITLTCLNPVRFTLHSRQQVAT